MTAKRTVYITNALPYANGSIHLGHMLEHIQSDIYARFERALGNDVYYVCADDCHGTPVMLKAAELGITPEQLIDQMSQEHKSDFSRFHISYDNYYRTNSPENNELCCELYEILNERGYIKTSTISQLYDPVKNMFLPDRYVKGICPRCGAEDQYGDNCEVCAATYNPTDLRNPYSIVSGATPVLKESLHYFFDLPAFTDFLKDYVGHVLPPTLTHKLDEWFDVGLRQWDISRDAPYFGFKIPGTEDKYFYVWVDAPVGYLASLKNYCDRNGINFDDFFREDSKAEMHHFIGKDILYFHSLFWPAVLKGASKRLPTRISVHGYVTVNGAKMSKSKGTFIKASTYLKHLNPECLRYYFASKLTAQSVDLDLSLEDFIAKVNSDIVGKVVNLASRTASFITKNFDGMLGSEVMDGDLLEQILEHRDKIIEGFENRNYQDSIRLIMQLADNANRFIDKNAPWVVVKDEERRQDLQKICTQGLNYFRALIIYLSPVLPALAKDAEEFLDDRLDYSGLDRLLLDHRINRFRQMFTRIDRKQVEAMVEDSKQDLEETRKGGKPGEKKEISGDYEPLEEQIGIDVFSKVDLRVATILSASEVEGADRLLRLELDLGFEKRQVFAGIKHAYKDVQALVGRKVVCVANLKPRQMKFGLSQGMVAAAGPGGDQVFLLSVDSGAENGQRVH